MSEVLFSTISENKDNRIDSTFYTTKLFYNPNLEYKQIGELLQNSQYGISIEMNEDNIGIPIYRMNEIHSMMCDLEVAKCADITEEEKKIFLLNDRDVLFNRTNSYEWVGRTGLYRKNKDENFVFASYLVRFVPDENILLPEYLACYLSSKYGVKDLKRRSRESINQTNINPEEVKECLIPIFSKFFQTKLKKCFDHAYDNKTKIQSLYSQAETVLLKGIGLKDFEPNRAPVNIKYFIESFIAKERLDAEYYQLKYEAYEDKIKKHPQGFTTVGDEYNLHKIISKKTGNDYNYIEIGDINVGDGTWTSNHLPVTDLPANAKYEVQKGDILISKVRPNRGAVTIIDVELPNLIVSGAFTVLREKEKSIFSNETLKVLLRTAIYKDWLLKFNIGTQYPVIRDEDILSLPIPKIEKDIQIEITQKLKKSHELKKESDRLLDLAKRAVEVAIEQGEQIALDYIKNTI